ncbi:GrpB family protein [Gracilibacillus oryzae]|uniref:GrpB family protein n=1 Tax=Gracilibacillus oryzae TaxID=1672701 RepID=A0A7C8KPS0_9BACI|nr:GrpB family protein [Gracilibacillus oryzae]KAB8126007.1 GrpB family protein [Gracilibacillus oryzae]
MLGINKGEVRLAAPSIEWKVLFQKEKKLLNELIGAHIKDLQHIGSTAIDGIDAKPVIDMVAGVTSMADIQNFDKEKLKASGYYHLHRVKIDGKAVFAKFSDLKNFTKTHILHVVEYEGDWWSQHIFFRDYLNQHPEAAKEYEAMKRDLAMKYPNNESVYTDEKKQFVDKILAKR